MQSLSVPPPSAFLVAVQASCPAQKDMNAPKTDATSITAPNISSGKLRKRLSSLGAFTPMRAIVNASVLQRNAAAQIQTFYHGHFVRRKFGVLEAKIDKLLEIHGISVVIPANILGVGASAKVNPFVTISLMGLCGTRLLSVHTSIKEHELTPTWTEPLVLQVPHVPIILCECFSRNAQGKDTMLARQRWQLFEPSGKAHGKLQTLHGEGDGSCIEDIQISFQWRQAKATPVLGHMAMVTEVTASPEPAPSRTPAQSPLSPSPSPLLSSASASASPSVSSAQRRHSSSGRDQPAEESTGSHAPASPTPQSPPKRPLLSVHEMVVVAARKAAWLHREARPNRPKESARPLVLVTGPPSKTKLRFCEALALHLRAGLLDVDALVAEERVRHLSADRILSSNGQEYVMTARPAPRALVPPCP